jgi:hypothetical protein
MTSPDGIAWTAQTAAAANSWRSVTYGNGLFVAVASNGTNRVMTSPDGINWTAQTVPLREWYSVTYGNGLYVATGDERVMTSQDGINWTIYSVGLQSIWFSVTYGNNLFVAASIDSEDEFLTSSDGVNWTTRNPPVRSYRLQSITYGNGLFLAVAYSVSEGDEQVMTSPDGINWTSHTVAGTGDWQSVAYGNGRFVAVGASGAPRVMISPDGFTPSVSIAADPGNSIAAGTPVTFTATPTDGGTAPSYQWKKNSNNVGTDSPTYMDNALADGDVISVEMTSNDPCANPAMATSNGITMEVANANPPGEALHFDGTNDLVNCGQPSAFNFNVGTIELMLKTTNAGGGFRALVTKPNAYGLYLNDNVLTVFDWGNGQIHTAGTNTSVVDGNWHHVALTFDALQNSVIYIDGLPVTTFSKTSAIHNTPLGIGADPGGAQFFQGSIDEVRLWNLVRTPAEILANATVEFCGARPGLVAYYPFNQGVADGTNPTETTLLDGSGNGLNGTLINFTLTGATSNWKAPDGTSTSPVVAPSLSIAASPGSALFAGVSVTFTATPTNGGAAPAYQWKKNSNPVGINSNTYTDAALLLGDVITCELTVADVCASPS